MDTLKAVDQVVTVLRAGDARRATKYLSPKLVVSVCRRHKPDKRAKYEEFVLKIGVPNYEEREFIRKCKKAGEPFPVKKIQVRDWPKRKK